MAPPPQNGAEVPVETTAIGNAQLLRENRDLRLEADRLLRHTRDLIDGLGDLRGGRTPGTWHETPAVAEVGSAAHFSEEIAMVRLRAEMALKESEEQFRRAIEEAPMAVIMQAEDGQVLQISRSWTQLTGFLLDEIPMFQGWFNRAYGYGAEAVRDRMRAVFADSNKSAEMEFDIIPRHGDQRRWIFSTSAPGRLNDGRRFAVGMAIDVTERRRTEAALRGSEERLRTLFDSMNEAFAVMEAIGGDAASPLDYRFVECNPGFTRQTGLGDPRGRTLSELMPNLGPPWLETCAAVLRTGQPVRFDAYVGSLLRWLGVSVSRLGGEGSRRIALVFGDITERKHREEAARDTERRKSEFLAMLGHELRNPLAAIKGGLRLLQSERARPESRAALPIVVQQVAHMERLIDDVLSLARMERGKFQVQPEPINLQQLLEGAIAMVRLAVEEKGAAVRLQCPPERITVHADAVRLTQVFVNLLTNAVKFSTRGGAVDVSVARERPGVAIRFRDYGAGIAPDFLPRIFEAFAQSKRALSFPDGLGLGLGLTISQQLVELHGGTLEAFSAGENLGSELVVRLPVPAAP